MSDINDSVNFLKNQISKNIDQVSIADLNNSYNKLCNIIKKSNHEYFTLDNSHLSDEYYDQIYQLLSKCENKFPFLKKTLSPTNKVGAKVSRRFNVIKHKIPMLSLKNIYSYEDIDAFNKKILKITEKKSFEYECEPKLDGLALSLHYKDGIFLYAITRGDGAEGEEVTENISAISNIPITLKRNQTRYIEVRGEVIIHKSDFLRINVENRKNKLIEFSNPRNMASGSIRQLENKNIKERKLKFYAYGIGVSKEYNLPKTQFDLIAQLKYWGFKIMDNIKIAKTTEELVDYYEKMLSIRYKLPYDIDGLVYKINNINIQKKVGFMTTAPRWAVAHKFPSKEAKTKLIRVDFLVGRTGLITPIARLKSVIIDGVKILNSTLHNIDYIKKNNIGMGDIVIVKRAGDVIPSVVRSLEKCNKEDREIKIPKLCPSCGSELILKNKTNLYCQTDWNCEAQKKQRIKHFVSKKAANIYGLGINTINQLIEKSIVSLVHDLYDLKPSDLIQLPGINQKSAKKLLNAIHASKNIKFESFIYCLGIDEIGEHSSKVLANHFNSLEALKGADLKKLLSIDNIGYVSAKRIIEFWSVQSNILMTEKLINKGVTINYTKKPSQKHKENIFYMKNVTITGQFKNFLRIELEEKLEKLGANIKYNLSKNTDILISGEKSGSKLRKAKELEISIFEEKKVNDILSRFEYEK